MSDNLHILASDFKILNVNDQKSTIDEIVDICCEYGVEKIVIGLPLNMDGSFGFQAEVTKEFGDKLSEQFEVIYLDERLSTKMAWASVEHKSKNKKEKHIDARAATMILQQYLDYN